MDGKRFDDLSRIVGAAPSRRAVLKGLAGGLAAGLVSLTGRRAEAQTRQPNGAVCSRATQCQSLKCVDGVCCNANCTGQCEACNVQGSVGTCVAVTGVPVGTRPACSGSGVCQGSCDGVTRNACAAYPGLDVVCDDPVCEAGWQTTYGCGGNGTCHPTTTSCGLYVCDPGGGACLTTCSSDAECVGEAFCSNGQCVEDRPLGEPCTTDAQCASGICAQGVCCVESCPGGCRACNVAGQLGFCTEIPDGGACDGGVCCDGECVNTQTSLEHCGACDNACRLVPAPDTCEDDPICNQGTCTFTPLPAGTLCRGSAGDCDVEERCNGASIACPPDAFAPMSLQCRPGGTGPNAVCDPAEFCPGDGPDCPDNMFAPLNTACETGNLCTNDICDGQGICVQGTPVVCPNPEQTCVNGQCVCPSGQPLDCGTFCGVECCTNNQCTPTEQCNADGVCECRPGFFELNGACRCDNLLLSGGPSPTDTIEVDDDLTVYLNGTPIFTDTDGVQNFFPPIPIPGQFGDQLRVVATDVFGFEWAISPLYLHCVGTGVVQVLDPNGFRICCEQPVGGVFYDETFTIAI